MAEIKLPAMSPTMEEGTLAKWLVKEGDTVKPGDVLAEIETDKATMELEADDGGVVTTLHVAAGTEGVKVGTLIATIAGEDDAPVRVVPAVPAPVEAPEQMPAATQVETKVVAKDPPPSLAVEPETTGPMRRQSVREALRDAMAEEMRDDAASVRDGRGGRRIPGRLQGHAGPARGVRRRSASSIRRSPNMALPASAPARRWAG